MKQKIDFKSEVSPTLLIPLYVRAEESKTTDAMIKDPMAESLVNQIDYDFGKLSKNYKSALCCVARAKYFDDSIIEFCQKHDNVVVVNVGCGLDTRYQRIGSVANAEYYEVDLPDVITLRKQLISETEKDHFIAGSVLDDDWIDQLKADHVDGNFIFVFEGVLMYFNPTQVKDIINRIGSRFKGAELYFEMFGDRRKEKGFEALDGFDAYFKSSANDNDEIEGWHLPIKLIEHKNHTEICPERWGFQGILNHLSQEMANQDGSLFKYKIV